MLATLTSQERLEMGQVGTVNHLAHILHLRPIVVEGEKDAKSK